MIIIILLLLSLSLLLLLFLFLSLFCFYFYFTFIFIIIINFVYLNNSGGLDVGGAAQPGFSEQCSVKVDNIVLQI
jgi:hypothetical protein